MSESSSLPKCILTGVDLTSDTDSKAHVIPSALGGRLKPKGILSRTANTELDDKFDNPLIEAFHPFMVLVAGSRDQSGEIPPVQAQDASGKQFKVGTDDVKLGRPEFSEEILPNGDKRYSIAARTPQEMRTLLGRVKKEHPNFDIDAMMKNASVERRPVGELNFQMQFGPISTFPAIFVMASVFSAYNKLAPHPEFVSYVNKFDANVRPMPPDTFYFLRKESWINNSAAVGHSLVLFGDPNRKQAIFYAELFNQPGIAVVLPYHGNQSAMFTYGVDVMRGAEVPISVDQALLSSFDWKSTHTNGDPELWAEVEKRSAPLLAIAHERSFEAAKDEILFKYFASNPGAVITQSDIEGASRELAELIMRRMYPGAEF